jgi:glycosyltransferase involved in cell wall biosynthesis/peptidoglycan/xylan/chitin deacetylase (PgdA/CDA1 family)
VAGWRGQVFAAFGHVFAWSGLGPLASWWWRRGAGGTWTLLAYHRVGRGEADGGPDRVDPKRFRAHLRYVKKRYDVLTVGEAVAALETGTSRSRPLLSLTFDDGYADNVTTALPILLEEGCRATLYPTLEAIEESRPPWTHRVVTACLALAASDAPPTPPPLPALEEFLRAAAGRSRRERLAEAGRLVGRLKRLPAAEREAVCEQAERLAGGAARDDATMMTADQLRAWSASGMEVGSHTHRHPILTLLPAVERRADLLGSRRGLETIVAAPVRHLAYPNGRAGDFDARVAEDARACGYLSAVTTIEGINRADDDPMALRRLSIGNDRRAVFAARLVPFVAAVRARAHRRGTSAAPAPRQAVRPLRIAFIGGRGIGSAYSGIERYYEELGARLAARGHRMIAYCRPHFAPPADLYRGIVVRRIPTLRSKHLETFVHTVLSTLDVCFRRVDLVQFHALGSSPFAWVPRLFGKRTVASVRGLDWQRAKWGRVARAYLRFCESTSVHGPNATVVVSQTLQRHFESRFGRRVRYIPNGVVRTTPVPADGIRRFGLAGGDYFLYAGRLSPEKGLHVMIEAHRPIDTIRLVLAGGSSYSEDYMAQLRAQGDGRVVFTGFLTGTLLEELYSNALAFVLPSAMEGLSVALLEAMSYGLPVIASDIPENRELVDACGGYLFRLDDVGDLRRVMQEVAAAPERARAVGSAARERVRAHFDWDRIAAETEVFYREVMAGRSAMPAAAAPRIEPSAPRTPRAEPLAPRSPRDAGVGARES